MANLRTRLSSVPTPEESFDALFGVSLDKNRIVRLKLCDLEFAPQKTPLNSDDELNEMAESIRRIGVKEPILVREMPADKTHSYMYYQVLNGRNRTEASRRAGLDDIPAIIENVTDAEAQYIIATTTLSQRQNLKTSVKAWAYRMQQEAKINLATSKDEVVPSGDTCLNDDVPRGDRISIRDLAEETGGSKTTIARYIRLTYLIENLLDLIDNNELPMKAGVSLSYLSSDEQEIIDAYLSENKVKISVEQSEDIKKYSKEIAPITYAVLNNMFKPVKTVKPTERTIKFSKPALNKVWSYIPDTLDDSEVQDYILKALIYYHNNQ